MALKDLPSGSIEKRHVLAVIQKEERRRTVVWTAWRVLKEDGSLRPGGTPGGNSESCYFKRIRCHLKSLLDDGILEERGTQFHYGAGTEVAYRFVGSDED
jgi:hypothetical protein